MIKKIYLVILAVMLFLLSYLIVSQIKTIDQSQSDILKMTRENDLRDLVLQEKEKNKIVSDKLEETENRLNEYMENISQTDKTIELLHKEIKQINVMAGLTNVKGTGIMITLKDADETSTSIALASEQLVHDTDLLQVVNELRAAGAEAISINEQRITSLTAIRCVGPTIMINEVKIGAPFVIKAIGNSDYLNSGINMKGGVVDVMKKYGIQIEVRQIDNVEIPKYEGAVKMTYTTNKED